MKKYFLSILLVIAFSRCFAVVTANSLFSNNMVLQRGELVPVWGTANNDEKVTVEFNGQKLSTVAKDGKWMVKLKPMRASNKPATMIITGENSIKIENILVGEVWVCSGQSNMEMTVSAALPKHITNWEEEVATANYPEIRQCFISRNASDTLVSDAKCKWQVCDTVSVKKFTAVGYFFARDLFKAIKVPVGIILSSVGGTSAELWTPKDDIEAVPELKGTYDIYSNAIKNYPAILAKFNASKEDALKKWAVDSATAAQNNKAIPAKPKAPYKPTGNAACLYNGMIHPIIPFAIKGVTWYQGEANKSTYKKYQYLFPLLINTWRKNWNKLDMPFLFVQIAPCNIMTPEIREAQFLTLNKVPNTAMSVTTDCGDADAIHAPFKQPIGYRLSLSARALAYKEKIEYSGPLYNGFEIKDNTIEISFTHIGKGLLAKDEDLKGFVIAGEDKKFLPAKAIIKGNKVVVTNDLISKPVAVRYGWANVPDVNLFNKEGLPASSFRTDVE